jgi:hypothetical protein
MNTYLQMTIAALVAVYVVDVSGFTDAWRDGLARLLRVKTLRPLPPFDCGKCAAFWTAIITAAVLHDFTLTAVAVAALLSLLSLPAGQVMLFIREGLCAIINALERWTNWNG